MERKLKRVFDYQKFSSSRRLGAMIAETERRYQAMADDDLFLVAAAGEVDMMKDFPEKNNAYRDTKL